MKFVNHLYFSIVVCFCLSTRLSAQSFTRSELTTPLTNPWEITYGPDGFLWLSESGANVVRVDPTSGAKTTVFTAADYFGGAPSEALNACFQPNIGAGTLGLTLHPDFLTPNSSYVYFVYSYNSGTTQTPATKFKIVRLTWNAVSATVTASLNLITNLPTSYDHLGGRLLAVKQNGLNYLYLSIGDHGISETNAPTCYTLQSTNPNNFTQDINFLNGKIHRFNMDGTIPTTNPVIGNSFYTRGHRNPQGLAFNPTQNILYDIEHGDRTDDEINIIEKGKNYGWKNVRGYHSDNNIAGEAAFVAGYTINPSISGDGLKEALYSWCATPQPTTTAFLDWCTVAPSDGIYYNSTAIPTWSNSLLVVTLKNGSLTDNEVFKFQLDASGTALVPSTTLTPNPQTFFGADQNLNGRLRDICISPDGKKIYLINNGGAATDKITVYTYNPPAISVKEYTKTISFNLSPNPTTGEVLVNSTEIIQSISIEDVMGKTLKHITENTTQFSISDLPSGIYFVKISGVTSNSAIKKIIKQ
jgi:aldose sugar dehydrogenase